MTFHRCSIFISVAAVLFQITSRQLRYISQDRPSSITWFLKVCKPTEFMEIPGTLDHFSDALLWQVAWTRNDRRQVLEAWKFRQLKTNALCFCGLKQISLIHCVHVANSVCSGCLISTIHFPLYVSQTCTIYIKCVFIFVYIYIYIYIYLRIRGFSIRGFRYTQFTAARKKFGRLKK